MDFITIPCELWARRVAAVAAVVVALLVAYDARRLLVVADSGINIRAKTLQPPN